LAYVKYGSLRGIKILLAILSETIAICMVTLKQHYSVDVWLALWIVPVLWRWLDLEFPDRIPKSWNSQEQQEPEAKNGLEKRLFVSEFSA
jgi:hypothetical protein